MYLRNRRITAQKSLGHVKFSYVYQRICFEENKVNFISLFPLYPLLKKENGKNIEATYHNQFRIFYEINFRGQLSTFPKV